MTAAASTLATFAWTRDARGRASCRGDAGVARLTFAPGARVSSRTLPRRGGASAASSASPDAAPSSDDDDVESVVIIGSGPAGYTAAIYAGRANLNPMVFEGFQAGGVPGGQLMTTTEVENFPGFPEGVTGPNLMDKMRQQAERWGAVLHSEDVERVDFTTRPFVVASSEREVRAHSVILATGATAKRLGIPSEERYWSRGISACAICDGPSPLFKDQDLAVVGGGDTAVEEALYLTKYGRHVHLIVRSESLKASEVMARRALRHPQITAHFRAECADATGNAKGFLDGIKLRNVATGEERTLKVSGLFYGIGHRPNSGFFADQVECDDDGYVVVRGGKGEGAAVATSVDGVFSAGDLHDKEWCQAITAAGSGCMAAISAERWLGSRGLLAETRDVEAQRAEKIRSAARVGNGDEAETVASEPSKSSDGVMDADTRETFDASAVRHKGQYALRKLYHESDRALVVLYSGPDCGPCKRLKPMLDKVLDEYGDEVHFVEIDIEADQEIAQAAGVVGTPCVHVFKDKARVEVLNGVKMKGTYREALDGCLRKAKVEAA